MFVAKSRKSCKIQNTSWTICWSNWRKRRKKWCISKRL